MGFDLRVRDRVLRERLRAGFKGNSSEAAGPIEDELRDHVDRLARLSDTSVSPTELNWALRSLRYWQEMLRLHFDTPTYGARPLQLRTATDLEVKWRERFVRRSERGQDATFDLLTQAWRAAQTSINELIEEGECESREFLEFLRTLSQTAQPVIWIQAYFGFVNSVLSRRLRLLRIVARRYSDFPASDTLPKLDDRESEKNVVSRV